MGPFGYIYALLKNAREIQLLDVLPSPYESVLVDIGRISVFHFEEELLDMSVSVLDEHLVTFSQKNTVKVYKVHSAFRKTILRTLPLYELSDAEFSFDPNDKKPLYQRFANVICVFL